MSRRIITLIAALVPIAIFVVIGSNVHVPFAALGPGPTVNTLASLDGTDVVEISGADLDETSGNLNMTTVEVRSSLTLFDAIGYWASGRFGVVPIAEVLPPGQSRDEVREANRAEFERSEGDAARAALAHLGMSAATVRVVNDDGAAAGALQEGDRIVAVDGEDAGSAADLVGMLSVRRPGEQVRIEFERPDGDGGFERGEASIVLGTHPDDAERGAMGVSLGDEPVDDIEIIFHLDDVGGPSAGLVFALAVVDKLSPGELNRGRFVAGTGTIAADGRVGPIGGIRYKLVAAQEAGATEFLVPAANCREAARHAPDGLTLIRVETLDDAIEGMEAASAGGDVRTC